MLGMIAGLATGKGVTLDRTFTVAADEEGVLEYEMQLRAPMTGRLIGFTVGSTSRCEGRLHDAELSVTPVDGGDGFEVGPVEIEDCEQLDVEVDFVAEGGRTYVARLRVDGFDPGETVEGQASARIKPGA
jgi:hypothetical protein